MTIGLANPVRKPAEIKVQLPKAPFLSYLSPSHTLLGHYTHIDGSTLGTDQLSQGGPVGKGLGTVRQQRTRDQASLATADGGILPLVSCAVATNHLPGPGAPPMASRPPSAEGSASPPLVPAVRGHREGLEFRALAGGPYVFQVWGRPSWMGRCGVGRSSCSVSGRHLGS